MSINNSIKHALLCTIRQVIENRKDVDAHTATLSDVVFHILSNSPVSTHFSQRQVPSVRTWSKTDFEEYQLRQIIELIALINRTIDFIMAKRKLQRSVHSDTVQRPSRLTPSPRSSFSAPP
jgi:hypothetical protein